MPLKNMTHKKYIMISKNVLNNKKIDSKNEFMKICINPFIIIL